MGYTVVQADILMVTDGEIGLPRHNVMDQLENAREKLGLEVSLILQTNISEHPDSWIDLARASTAKPSATTSWFELTAVLRMYRAWFREAPPLFLVNVDFIGPHITRFVAGRCMAYWWAETMMAAQL